MFLRTKNVMNLEDLGGFVEESVKVQNNPQDYTIQPLDLLQKEEGEKAPFHYYIFDDSVVRRLKLAFNKRSERGFTQEIEARIGSLRGDGAFSPTVTVVEFSNFTNIAKQFSSSIVTVHSKDLNYNTPLGMFRLTKQGGSNSWMMKEKSNNIILQNIAVKIGFSMEQKLNGAPEIDLAGSKPAVRAKNRTTFKMAQFPNIRFDATIVNSNYYEIEVEIEDASRGDSIVFSEAIVFAKLAIQGIRPVFVGRIIANKDFIVTEKEREKIIGTWNNVFMSGTSTRFHKIKNKPITVSVNDILYNKAVLSTVKYDGERTFMLCTRTDTYLITPPLLRKIRNPVPSLVGCILDGELVGDVYYIFDALRVKNRNVFMKPFLDRFVHVSNVGIKLDNPIVSEIKSKVYYPSVKLVPSDYNPALSRAVSSEEQKIETRKEELRDKILKKTANEDENDEYNRLMLESLMLVEELWESDPDFSLVSIRKQIEQLKANNLKDEKLLRSIKEVNDKEVLRVLPNRKMEEVTDKKELEELRLASTINEKKYIEKIIRDRKKKIAILSAYESGITDPSKGTRKALEQCRLESIPTDGIIFQDTLRGYQDCKNKKWKPVDQQTIDFLVLKRNGVYTLNVYGKNNNTIPFTGGYGTTFEGGKVANPDISFGEQIKNVHGKIVEMSWDGEDFMFHRFRTDRNKPNYIDVAINVWKNILRPISSDTISLKDMKAARVLFNDTKKDILEKVCFPGCTVIDIGSGQGGDIAKWKGLKINTIFAVEPDTDKIVELKKRLDQTKTTNVRIIEEYFGTEECLKALKQEMSDRGVKKVDVVVAFFSLTFFSPSEIENLVAKVNELLSDNGTFVGIVLDGEKLKEKFETGVQSISGEVDDEELWIIELDEYEEEEEGYSKIITTIYDNDSYIQGINEWMFATKLFDNALLAYNFTKVSTKSIPTKHTTLIEAQTSFSDLNTIFQYKKRKATLLMETLKPSKQEEKFETPMSNKYSFLEFKKINVLPDAYFEENHEVVDVFASYSLRNTLAKLVNVNPSDLSNKLADELTMEGLELIKGKGVFDDIQTKRRMVTMDQIEDIQQKFPDIDQNKLIKAFELKQLIKVYNINKSSTALITLAKCAHTDLDRLVYELYPIVAKSFEYYPNLTSDATEYLKDLDNVNKLKYENIMKNINSNVLHIVHKGEFSDKLFVHENKEITENVVETLSEIEMKRVIIASTMTLSEINKIRRISSVKPKRIIPVILAAKKGDIDTSKYDKEVIKEGMKNLETAMFNNNYSFDELQNSIDIIDVQSKVLPSDKAELKLKMIDFFKDDYVRSIVFDYFDTAKLRKEQNEDDYYNSIPLGILLDKLIAIQEKDSFDFDDELAPFIMLLPPLDELKIARKCLVTIPEYYDQHKYIIDQGMNSIRQIVPPRSTNSEIKAYIEKLLFLAISQKITTADVMQTIELKGMSLVPQDVWVKLVVQKVVTVYLTPEQCSNDPMYLYEKEIMLDDYKTQLREVIFTPEILKYFIVKYNLNIYRINPSDGSISPTFNFTSYENELAQKYLENFNTEDRKCSFLIEYDDGVFEPVQVKTLDSFDSLVTMNEEKFEQQDWRYQLPMSAKTPFITDIKLL